VQQIGLSPLFFVVLGETVVCRFLSALTRHLNLYVVVVVVVVMNVARDGCSLAHLVSDDGSQGTSHCSQSGRPE
jgi:hypothetical protein